MDVNNDKLTSRAELAEGIVSEWSSFQRDPSAIYFKPWVIENFGTAEATANFMSFDQDFNGVIDQDEFRERLENEFSRLDENGDGNLARSEMVVVFLAPQGQRSRGSGQGGGRERGRGEGRGGGRPN